MPSFVTSIELARSAAEIFDYLARPANVGALAPAELRLELVEGPPRIALGTLLHWKARRMGVSQSIINEITAFEEATLIGEEQRSGPFKRWALTHRFKTKAAGTLLTTEIAFEPPGGMLGLLVTAEVIRRDLEKLFTYRAERLAELFG
jgi:ligand-binding SRPBCC domain-containing protein